MPSFEKKVGTARASGQKITFVRTKFLTNFYIKVGIKNKSGQNLYVQLLFVRTFLQFVRTVLRALFIRIISIFEQFILHFYTFSQNIREINFTSFLNFVQHFKFIICQSNCNSINSSIFISQIIASFQI